MGVCCSVNTREYDSIDLLGRSVFTEWAEEDEKNSNDMRAVGTSCSSRTAEVTLLVAGLGLKSHSLTGKTRKEPPSVFLLLQTDNIENIMFHLYVHSAACTACWRTFKMQKGAADAELRWILTPIMDSPSKNSFLLGGVELKWVWWRRQFLLYVF